MKPCKQLVDIGNQTMLERVISNTLKSEVDETIVVLGYKANEISEKISEKDIKITINSRFRKGMSTSLKKGLEKSKEDTNAFLFVLGDQPLIRTNVINEIIQNYKNTEYDIVAPTFEKIRGHPVLFDASLKSELMKIKGDIGAKNILERKKEDIKLIDFGTQSVILDVDTNEDLKKVRNLIKREGSR